MISIRDIYKTYRMGNTQVHALRGVSLAIEPGEFVAIMGPSGSGKSTLMHILGLLDVPDSGSYHLYGREVAHLKEDELAVLRREAIGFIFQQFNLLPRITAWENVSLPLLYTERRLDHERAKTLLEKVNLGDRLDHKSNELSGGQQQRVAIARSMINNPGMVLADEPTGNLDSVSEKEIMEILRRLNEHGITVVLVTHEEEIGRQAKRLIRMRDGMIQSDERHSEASLRPAEAAKTLSNPSPDQFHWGEILEHFRQGFRSLAGNKVRTFLSMLGILIGVAAVVAMLALGQGAQKAIERQLASLGSNLLVLRSGSVRVGGVSLESGTVTRLTLEDVASLEEKVPGIQEASPTVSGRVQVTYQDKNWNTQVTGAGPSYARMHAAEPTVGRFFTEEENRQRVRLAVLGKTVVRELFEDQNPLGEMIKINKVNFQVIGILPEKGATAFRDQDDVIVIPVLTAMHRLLGKDYVDSVDIEVESPDQMEETQRQTREFLLAQHRVPPSQQQGAFDIRNMADVQAALSESSRTMSVLLSSIAAISLLVGGIGIMNIMLVSVTERTREIGLRKAVGARRRDILSQFLIEAIVITSIGGGVGILLGWGTTELMARFTGWSTLVSGSSIFLAFSFSAAIGLIFGIFPAKKASRLNPIVALRYE